MRTQRIGQAVALALFVLLIVATAAAQTAAPAAPSPPTTAPPELGWWVAFVKDVGFPIAAFVLLFWLVRTTIRENTRAVEDLRMAVVELKAMLTGGAATKREVGRQ